MNELFIKFEKTGRFYLKKCLSSLRKCRYSLWPIELQAPIFVVGCSRAGTTLVYKTFSESRELGSLQKETHDFWAGLHPTSKRDWASHQIPKEQACDLDRKQAGELFYCGTGKTRIVDKNNQNGLSIPYLHALFPDAHFVFIKRNPGDNIESLIKGWGKASEFGAWSKDLPVTIEVDGGAYRNWCFFLAEGWKNYSRASIEEVCAFQYESMNRAILDARDAIPAQQWHEVSYEAVLANPVDEFRGLFEACDLPFDSRLEQHCAKVLDNPYNTFSEIGVDKWMGGEYKSKIQKVLQSMNSISKDLGY
ncbi:MAG: sulfotransferase [Gammaproteobacteria bacterium]|nr:sulfotransferase [Gammaproteobacteria bacterium]MBQ0838657.1 sulfotransferase [Gammaproteobacteria bacterium]